MERLAMMLEHTQVTGVKPRSINVIQRINPTYIPAEEPKPKKDKDAPEKGDDKKKKGRR